MKNLEECETLANEIDEILRTDPDAGKRLMAALGRMVMENDVDIPDDKPTNQQEQPE